MQKKKKSPNMGIHVHVPEHPCVYFLIPPLYIPAGFSFLPIQSGLQRGEPCYSKVN